MPTTTLSFELERQLGGQLAATQDQIHLQKISVALARDIMHDNYRNAAEYLEQALDDFYAEKVTLKGLRRARNFLRNELGMNSLGQPFDSPPGLKRQQKRSTGA